MKCGDGSIFGQSSLRPANGRTQGIAPTLDIDKASYSPDFNVAEVGTRPKIFYFNYNIYLKIRGVADDK